ncbi:tRNA (adenine-N1)-methyltransferase [Meiothermus sp. QL-1]|uniref:tRNA (adenine-N1)-methyltransferase n=1 Tax=Meiothermus sp. QL-1 TaxID=2058095 RepID=UPI000E0C2481|nr:tRNA (adenine-N1)-methyltransferase [Meiothermus sp. QL-1]RDI95158.1 tRNA (adenine-N1)-methyltransferase [Meiothermus sp. QL-1]
MTFGELALLQDSRGRTYLFRLQEGGAFHYHRGFIRHEAIQAAGPGGRLVTPHGEVFTVHRPSLEDYVLKMPRAATPTYPKDAITLCLLLDLAPGMRVLEAGSGSGGLTLFLARAVGPSGEVHSYENRPRHLAQAQHNLRAFEDWGNVTWVEADLAQAELPLDFFDAVALDMMEPWKVLPAVTPALKVDRFLACYLPNLTQVLTLLQSIEAQKLPYLLERTLEVLHREWEIRPPVAHPRFQQVGHTAFLVQLRRLKD